MTFPELPTTNDEQNIAISQGRPSARSIDRFILSPRATFMEEFLQRETDVFDNFRMIFRIILFLSIGVTIIQILLSFAIFASMKEGGASPLVLIQAIGSVIEFSVIAYVASLCRDFVILRSARLQNESYNEQVAIRRLETMKMDIEKKIESRAGAIKAGDNAIIIVNSQTGDIEQTITTSADLQEPLALLIAYAEESGRAAAIAAAKQLAKEASKAEPDKSVIFKLWNGIVAVLPSVADVAKIASGIMRILV